MRNLLIFITVLLASCSNRSVNPNSIEGEWSMYELGNVMFYKSVKMKLKNGNYYRYLSTGDWAKEGRYRFTDSTFTLITPPDDKEETVFFELSKTGDTLKLRSLYYRTQYPNGDEPIDKFRRRK